MDERDQSVQSLIVQYVVAHMQCSGCGRRYEPVDVHVHNHRGHIWLASLACRHCGLRGVLVATVQAQDAKETATALEYDAEEWVAFQEMGPISDDEMLEFHRFLTGFDGDVMNLLRQRH